MKSRVLSILIVDMIILIISYLIMVASKNPSISYLSPRYLIGFSIFLLVWISFSGYFKKYQFKRKNTLPVFLKRVIISNVFSLSFILIIVMVFNITGYSRLVFFGTIIIATTAELFLGNLYFLLIHTRNQRTDLFNPPPKNFDLKRARQGVNYRDQLVSDHAIMHVLERIEGREVYNFISLHANVNSPHLLMVSTTTRFNIEFQPDDFFRHIINLRRINDIRFINKFFETINRKLPKGGLFTGKVETKDQRKKRIYRKFPFLINRIVYFIDFIVKRVFPKFIMTKHLYFLLTRGNNRVLTKAETLGRLYSCGFEIVDDTEINGYFYFIARKKEEPAYDMNPTYGPFIKLDRIGKDGKLFKVYKFRTMHPYAEYIQHYIYEKHHLDKGGKFKNDFRISSLGKFMRTFWLDELPMIINLLKGQMKIVGVRPLSRHYFELYSKELQELRTKYKPGLIPPYYADMPNSLEEIQESELRYLKAFEKHPFLTNWVYFWRAVKNILFKSARSK